MIAAKAAWAAASSAAVGSSRSQSGRSATRSRASATRRFCPAESARAGKSITWARPTRASAAPARLARGLPPKRAGPEGEVLVRGQRAFQRIGVAEIMGLFAERALGIAALQRKPSRLDRKKAGEGAQKRRFAGAVGACHDQRRALARPRTKARKTGAVRRVRSQAATHEGASHPLENARRAGRFKTIVCVACLREFIYKPTIPRLPAFRSAPWPASTVSNAANR